MNILPSSNSDAYVTPVPGHPTNVDNGEDLLAPRNVLTSTQTTLDQVIQVGYFGYSHIPLIDLYSKDTNSSPAVQSLIIVALQQLVKATGVLPARYVINDVTSSGVVEARGGFADVYRGNSQGKVVCIKVNRFARDTQNRVRTNILIEAVLCGSLSHPNIVPLFGVYIEGITLSLVYPWMENGDLVMYLQQHPLSSRVQLLSDVALGLGYLHERSIVHGDLKGVNILVNDSGRALIADFGLASILPSSGGTLMYKAPEILDPVAYNTKETDIYALGCVAYEVFAGKPPFANLRPHLIVIKVMDGHRPERPDASPSWNVWGLTEDVWALIERCWHADPASRPAIDAVIQCLKHALPPDM
ncbi:hypothetical protein H0H92_011814 [Tricholoma furcatifolium]|nr:hypothetical protein H0H92_011814 [Tricholoma furcatifolium]